MDPTADTDKITEEMHRELMQTSDDIFDLFIGLNVSSHIAFLALCMTVARMALTADIDVANITTLLTAYKNAAGAAQLRNRAAKNGIAN